MATSVTGLYQTLEECQVVTSFVFDRQGQGITCNPIHVVLLSNEI